VLPCVLQHQTLPPSQGGLRGCHVSNGPGPASQPRWTLTSPCVPWFWTYEEGSKAPCVLWL
jgi:hypothetical protein